jgi:hypothetical protein
MTPHLDASRREHEPPHMLCQQLPNLPLEDALQLVHLYAERGSPKFEPAARRWLERYLTEGHRASRTWRKSRRDSPLVSVTSHAPHALPGRALGRSKPPIDPEQTRHPTSEESPESFTFTSGPTWTTGDEAFLLLVGHAVELNGRDVSGRVLPPRSTIHSPLSPRCGHLTQQRSRAHVRPVRPRCSLGRHPRPSVAGSRGHESPARRIRCTPAGGREVPSRGRFAVQVLAPTLAA